MCKVLCLILLLWSSFSFAQQKVNVLADQLNDRPFIAAVQAEAWSIEVDVVVKDDVLYAASSLNTIQPNQTFDQLYLQPAMRLGQRKKSQLFHLLVNVKDEFEVFYPLINSLLKSSQASFQDKMQLVFTGNIPSSNQWTKYPNYIYFAGAVEEVYNKKTLEKLAMLIADFKKYSNWDALGNFSVQDQAKVKEVVAVAKSMSKPLLFKNAPNTEVAAEILRGLGVEVIDITLPAKQVDLK